MKKSGYQQRVADFVDEHKLAASVETRLLDLLSELGEVAKEALKGSQYGKSGFTATPDWEQELADAFFSLICIANMTGVDLDSALDKVLEKYQTRLGARGDAGSGR
jgi:NTP pyrophosphatase (non-canonical NTP hydrolase)